MRIGLIANTLSQASMELSRFCIENADDIIFRVGMKIYFKDGTDLVAHSRDRITMLQASNLDQLFLVNNLQYNENVYNAIAEVSSRTCVPDKYIIVKLSE